MGPSVGVVTQLLVAWREGDETAKDQLFALLYEDLHQIAHEQRKKWRGSSTLNTTALLHELYVRLSRLGAVRAEDRDQLNRFVAKALRRILIDYAEAQGRQRRGGDWTRIPLDTFSGEQVAALEMQIEESLMIDAALSKLETIDARLAEVVELRFYGGLTHEEIAQSLGVRPSWLQFGVEEVGALSEDAIEVARAWSKLEEPHRTAMREAILRKQQCGQCRR